MAESRLYEPRSAAGPSVDASSRRARGTVSLRLIAAVVVAVAVAALLPSLPAVGQLSEPTPVDARARFTPDPVTFGRVAVGSTSADEPVTVVSAGTDPLSISAITLGGTDAGDFRLVTDTCPRAPEVLLPQERCRVTMQLQPSAEGARLALLSLESNGRRASTAVSLVGSGLPADSAAPIGPQPLIGSVVLQEPVTSLRIEPAKARPNALVTATGTGFNGQVDLFWSVGGIHLASVTTDDQGSVRHTFRLPDRLTGRGFVIACDSAAPCARAALAVSSPSSHRLLILLAALLLGLAGALGTAVQRLSRSRRPSGPPSAPEPPRFAGPSQVTLNVDGSVTATTTIANNGPTTDVVVNMHHQAGWNVDPRGSDLTLRSQLGTIQLHPSNVGQPFEVEGPLARIQPRWRNGRLNLTADFGPLDIVVDATGLRLTLQAELGLVEITCTYRPPVLQRGPEVGDEVTFELRGRGGMLAVVNAQVSASRNARDEMALSGSAGLTSGMLAVDVDARRAGNKVLVGAGAALRAGAAGVGADLRRTGDGVAFGAGADLRAGGRRIGLDARRAGGEVAIGATAALGAGPLGLDAEVRRAGGEVAIAAEAALDAGPLGLRGETRRAGGEVVVGAEAALDSGPFGFNGEARRTGGEVVVAAGAKASADFELGS